MPNVNIPRVPDDWTVWAFSDSHGVTSGLVAALRDAGILDVAGHWIAPRRTALIGCGDYIDRGGDIPGMVALLHRLEEEAADSGGMALFSLGNHEAMPLMIRDGAYEWMETWLTYGGDATMASYGCEQPIEGGPMRLADSLEACAPGLLDWLDRRPQAVRWRDVLFVHGGLPPRHSLDDLGRTTGEHLWIRAKFYDTAWDSGAFDGYSEAGIERVVFGHTPQPEGPKIFHAGRSIDIDTNAVGNPRMPVGARQTLTLLGLSGDVPFGDARLIAVPTADAPDANSIQVAAAGPGAPV